MRRGRLCDGLHWHTLLEQLIYFNDIDVLITHYIDRKTYERDDHLQT